MNQIYEILWSQLNKGNILDTFIINGYYKSDVPIINEEEYKSGKSGYSSFWSNSNKYLLEEKSLGSEIEKSKIITKNIDPPPKVQSYIKSQYYHKKSHVPLRSDRRTKSDSLQARKSLHKKPK